MGTDHGTVPATLGSPAPSANKRGAEPSPSLEVADEDDGAEIGIELEFKRKLSGLRRLPRHARAEALRLARNERSLALKALREKRRNDRLARYLRWRQQLPAPKPLG